MSSDCDSACEVGVTQHHNPTEEITLNTVFLKLGQLDGKLDGMLTQLEQVQDVQRELNLKVENVATLAAMPHECNKEGVIIALQEEVRDLRDVKNKVLGGKAVLVLVVILLASVLGTALGAYVNYKIGTAVRQFEAKLEDGSK
jgi:hypothetical protein